jgi:hypothetical protein
MGGKYGKLRPKSKISSPCGRRKASKRFVLDEDLKIASCYEAGEDGF